MTDKELLELAAKAAGYKKYINHHLGRDSFVTYDEEYYSEIKGCRVTGEKTLDWSPLQDDGDAFRLAVHLELTIHQWPGEVCVCNLDGTINESVARVGDIYAATRRAIVRAAAEIGRYQE